MRFNFEGKLATKVSIKILLDYTGKEPNLETLFILLLYPDLLDLNICKEFCCPNEAWNADIIIVCQRSSSLQIIPSTPFVFNHSLFLSSFRLILVVMFLPVIIWTTDATVFSYYERWEFFDALYYCFATLTTIGTDNI